MRPPLGDMTNDTRGNCRPKRNVKPSTRLQFLTGDDTLLHLNTSKSAPTPVTGPKDKENVVAERNKTNKKPKDDIIQSRSTRSGKKTTKQTPENQIVEAKPTKRNAPAKVSQDEPIKKPTTKKKAVKLPAETPKPPSDSAIAKNEISRKRGATTKETKPPTPVKKDKKESELKISKSVEKSIDCSDSPAANKPARIPIYKRIEALKGTSSPALPPEKLYDFPIDPKSDPSKPVKKRNVKRKQPSAPRRKKKDAQLNQTEDLAKLIRELKKIRAATKESKIQKPMQPPPLNVPLVTLSPAPGVARSPISIASSSPMPAANSFVGSPRSTTPGKNDLSDEFAADTEGICNSTFIEHPIASSSMIRPAASPWRVNCNDASRWPKNFYVKPSMTPAYERDTSHAFTLDPPKRNLDQSNAEKAPIDPKDYTLYKDNVSEWRQTSIISCYEKTFNKSPKKRGRSPKKSVKSQDEIEEDAKKAGFEPSLFDDEIEIIPETSNNATALNIPSASVKDAPVAVIENCFGFDDSPEIDQENVSPKKIPKLKSIKQMLLKNKKPFGNVLKEVNKKSNAPTRMSPKKVMNVLRSQKRNAEKETVAELFTQDEPVETDRIPEEVPSTSADIQLFAEDIEITHYNKPSRKSYERKKKPPSKSKPKNAVKFTEPADKDESGSDSDESVEIIKKVVKKKPPALSKKEEVEADKWATEFNSLLEEADDFDLCVE